jgi:hypothetical protein
MYPHWVGDLPDRLSHVALGQGFLKPVKGSSLREAVVFDATNLSASDTDVIIVELLYGPYGGSRSAYRLTTLVSG